jgi:hypothetical protein
MLLAVCMPPDNPEKDATIGQGNTSGPGEGLRPALPDMALVQPLNSVELSAEPINPIVFQRGSSYHPPLSTNLITIVLKKYK